MSKFNRTASLIGWVVLIIPETGFARDPVEVTLNKETAKYCHVVRFPLGWQELEQNGQVQEPPKFDFAHGSYAFRIPGNPGLSQTTFLIRGFSPFLKLDEGYYTKNLYSLDLADPVGIAQPASEEQWRSARIVPSIDVQNREFHFVATGAHGERDRLSPIALC